MFERIRSEKSGPWIVLGGILLAALFVGIVGITYSHVYEAVYHDHATGKAQADASEKFKKECSEVVTIKEALACFGNTIESAREPQRSEEDLYAQKKMAQWAFWLLFFTVLIGIVSVGITVVGINYVRRTLLEMELQRGVSQGAVDAAIDSNKVAREVGQAQVRAYLTCIGGTWNIDHYMVYCHATLKNTGQSPAKRIRIKALLAVTVDEREADSLFVFSHVEIGEKIFGLLRRGNVKFWIEGRLFWHDVFNKEQSVPIFLHQIPDVYPVGDVRDREGTFSAYNQGHESS